MLLSASAGMLAVTVVVGTFYFIRCACMAKACCSRGILHAMPATACHLSRLPGLYRFHHMCMHVPTVTVMQRWPVLQPFQRDVDCCLENGQCMLLLYKHAILTLGTSASDDDALLAVISCIGVSDL